MDIGIVIVDRDERIVASNPQAAKLFKVDKLPSKIPAFVKMYTFPSRVELPCADWICHRVLREKRPDFTIVGVTVANQVEVVWLWIIAEPHGEDVTDAVRAQAY